MSADEPIKARPGEDQTQQQRRHHGEEHDRSELERKILEERRRSEFELQKMREDSMAREMHRENEAAVALAHKAEELQRINTQLMTVVAATTTFLESGRWDEASRQLLQGALDQTGSTLGLVVCEGERGAAKIWAQVGFRDTFSPGWDPILQLLGAPSGPLLVQGPPVMPPASSLAALAFPAKMNGLAMIPIRVGGQSRGAIAVMGRADPYGVAELSKLEILAQTAGILFDNHCRVERESMLHAQLRQSQKMEAVGSLASGIAHDFNNLLTIIQGSTQILMDSIAPEAPYREYGASVLQACDQAASLTRQLLTFCSRQVVQWRVLDVNVVVQRTSKLLSRVIGEHIRMELQLTNGVCPVRADVVQLEQILMNFALNARDAMPSGGALTISTATIDIPCGSEFPVGVIPGPYIVLSVSDTGHGMSESVQARIFEPFFTTKERGKGTGLGLSTVYGIVKQSGGEVVVESRLGVGSSFLVYLPQVDQPLDEIALTDKKCAERCGGETVLLAEDDSTVRMLVSRELSRRGYTVLEARDGQEALKQSDQHAGLIHVLLTDMVMPGMGGRELADMLKQRRPGIRVVFLSGYTAQSFDMEDKLDPEAHFLHKPFSPMDLLGAVQKALDAPVAAVADTLDVRFPLRIDRWRRRLSRAGARAHSRLGSDNSLDVAGWSLEQDQVSVCICPSAHLSIES